MNLSGGPVAGLVQYFSIPPTEVIVVHDELDLDFGVIRLKRGGGEGGHNGLRSISKALGTKDYLRVRFGIGRPPGRQDPADYVLKRFSGVENKELDLGWTSPRTPPRPCCPRAWSRRRTGSTRCRAEPSSTRAPVPMGSGLSCVRVSGRAVSRSAVAARRSFPDGVLGRLPGPGPRPRRVAPPPRRRHGGSRRRGSRARCRHRCPHGPRRRRRTTPGAAPAPRPSGPRRRCPRARPRPHRRPVRCRSGRCCAPHDDHVLGAAAHDDGALGCQVALVAGVEPAVPVLGGHRAVDGEVAGCHGVAAQVQDPDLPGSQHATTAADDLHLDPGQRRSELGELPHRTGARGLGTPVRLQRLGVDPVDLSVRCGRARRTPRARSRPSRRRRAPTPAGARSGRRRR